MLNTYSPHHRALGLWLVAVALVAAHPAPAANCTWIDGNSTWSNASSWSCGTVPGPGDNVTINTFVTVTLDMDVTVREFFLSNGTLDGAGDLTVTGPFALFNGGKLFGTGTLIAEGGTTITGQGPAIQISRTLDLASNSVWSGNNITLREGALIRNRSGRTFTDQAAVGQTHSISVPSGTSTLPTIENAGTWVHAGAGTSILSHFVNTGTLVVKGAGLEFVGPSQFVQGNTAVLQGMALLDVDSGITFSNSGSTQPGEAAAVPARLSVRGDFPMTTDEHDLEINLVGPAPGTGYDQLAVENGDVTVNGRLYLTFADGFVPTVGQRFDVLVHTGSGTVSGCYAPEDVIVSPEEYEVTIACTSEGIAAEVIGVTAGEPGRPTGADLVASVYPNPVSRSARQEVNVECRTTTSGPVRVEVYDVLGRSVATVFDGPQAVGTLRAVWHIGGVPAGLYVVRINADGHTVTRRLTVVD